MSWTISTEKEQDLKEQLKTLLRRLDALSADLTKLRTAAAARLSQEMTEQLTELNFKNVRFDARSDRQQTAKDESSTLRKERIS